MTGYGRCHIEEDGREMTVEVKSVNHRFLDISFRLNRALSFLDDAVRKGVSAKLAGAISMAALFALVESFLAATSNHSFIWVYKWWGVLPVFVTTYIPFFLASNYVPDWEPTRRNRFLLGIWGLDALLLVTLIPLGII